MSRSIFTQHAYKQVMRCRHVQTTTMAEEPCTVAYCLQTTIGVSV